MFSIIGRKSRLPTSRILFTGCLLFCTTLFAQQPTSVKSKATSLLLTQAREMMADNAAPTDLIPYLKEILVRLEGNTSDEAKNTRIFCMYQIGVCEMRAKKYAEATAAFESFIKDYPEDSSASSAALLAAESYALQKNWPASEKAIRPLLKDKRFDAKKRLTVRQILSEALYRQEKWKEATVPLLEIFDQADRKEDRSSAALMLAVCYAKADDYENLVRFLSYCGDSVRKDVGLNMALIESGDKQSTEGNYQNALKLYRMVLKKEELITYYEHQMQRIKKSLAEPFVQRVGATRSAYDEAHRLKQMQYDRMAEQLKAIRAGQDYDLDIALRKGRCYAGLKRKWVAYMLYNHIYTTAPKSKQAEESRFQAFMLLLNMPQEQAQALKEGLAYLDHYPSNKYTDEVSLNLTQLLLMTGKTDEAQAMGQRALKLNPNHRFIDQIRYLLAYIDFQKQNYKTARAEFTEILSRWPKGVYAEASEYWQAMCYLFLAQYDDAVSAFEAYLKNPAYPKKSFDEDASYRLGIALYGKGDFSGSEKTFRRFLQDYPTSVLRSEAYSMLGDLRGADGELDVALDFYRKALDSASNLDQENYAVFQAAKVYELQKNYPAIITLMENYLKDRGEEGNFAGAGFWMGKAYKAMNQYSKAIDTYVDAVVRFGNNPTNDNVDLIIRELIKEYKSKQGQADKTGFANTLAGALRKAKNRGKVTLTLRLQTFFAYTTEGAARERYVSEILKEKNIEKAGALTLQLFAEEALRRKDYALVHKVYARFMSTFEASEILPDVMNVELGALVQEKKYTEAEALAEDITGRFGYRTQIGLTRKLKADALRLSKKYDDAIKTYNELFAVREWRGPLTPEALYWIGVCLEAQGKTDEAFAYFQRVYVLYDGYVDWAARAYESSFQCLEKLGRRDDMLKTLREMLSKPDIAATPEGKRAQAQLAKLESAGGEK